MASLLWDKRRQYEPLSFLSGRAISPQSRRPELFLRQRVAHARELFCKDFSGHYGCVNAIEFSHGLGEFIASGGDDRRVMLWNVEKALSDIGKPAVMKGEHNSNIFCIAFDIHNTTAFSGGNDEQVVVHDLTTGETKDVFSHEDVVYGLSTDPTNPNVFASSCDDGRVLIYDTRDSTADPFCLANYTSPMHSVMYNPFEPRLLATANAKEGVGLWDVRKPRSCVLRYGGSFVQQSCMSVRFNQRGDQLIALRRRLPPVLYKIDSNEPVCEFDHSEYYNSCTMKSICYAGDQDQYILSGSDEFNLYMWAVPEDLSERMYINSAHMVLKGHRSIVNQVRFNIANHLVISSGVEKVIKVWSPFKHSDRTTTLPRRNVLERPVYSHEEYINLVLQDGHVMSHDYSQESTEEDPRMMAFFDSLVQRELEGWSSDDSLSSNEEALYSRIVQLSRSDIDSDDSLAGSGGRASGDDPSFSPFTIAFASVMASQATEGNDRFPRLNSALEHAERANAEVSERNDVQQAQDVVPEVSGTEVNSQRESSSRKDISELVKKKKMELREVVKKRIKECKPLVSSSSSSDSESTDLESFDNESINIVIGKDENKMGGECSHTNETSNNVLENKSDNRLLTQLKLKRLRNLRNSILNSESENSDLELKRCESDTLTTQTKCETNSEKVEFKKFKRRNSETKTKESKDVLKARASPDLGPYLQKTVAATSIEVRRSSVEERINKKGKHFPNETSSLKGKHYSKLDHKHKKDGVSSVDSCHKHKQGKYSLKGYSFEENRFNRRTKSADSKDPDSTEENDHGRNEHHQKGKRGVTKNYLRHPESKTERERSCAGKHTHHTGDRIRGKHHSDSEKKSKVKSHKDSTVLKDLCESCRQPAQTIGTDSLMKNDEDKDIKDSVSPQRPYLCEKCQHLHETRLKKYDSKSFSRAMESSDKRSRGDKNSKNDNERTKKSYSSRKRKHSNHSDGPTPSCSYSSLSETSGDKTGEKSNTSAKSDTNTKQNRQRLAESHDWNEGGSNKSSGNKCTISSSSDEEADNSQPTWTEFKRFKNRLERARKHYKEHKHNKK